MTCLTDRLVITIDEGCALDTCILRFPAALSWKTPSAEAGCTFRAAIGGRIPGEALVRRAVAPWHASRAHVVVPHSGRGLACQGTQIRNSRASEPHCLAAEEATPEAF